MPEARPHIATQPGPLQEVVPSEPLFDKDETGEEHHGLLSLGSGDEPAHAREAHHRTVPLAKDDHLIIGSRRGEEALSVPDDEALDESPSLIDQRERETVRGVHVE